MTLPPEDLSAFLDGELPAERAAEVERALANQPGLRARLDELRATRAQVHRLKRVRGMSRFRTRSNGPACGGPDYHPKSSPHP